MKSVLLTLLIAIASPAFCDPTTNPAASTQPISTTIAAIRKLQVMGDPPKSFGNYVQHIASDLGLQILGSASSTTGNEVLHFKEDGNYITLEIDLSNTGPFPHDELRPAAAEFLDGIIDRVQKEMQADFKDRRDRQLSAREIEVQEIRRQRDESSQRLDDYRAMLRKQTGRLDVTPANLREAMSKLQDEHQQLELDLRGKEARAAALADAIAELTKEANAKNNSDDVLAELQQVVEAREKQLELMKKNYASGLNSSVEVQQVAAQAAEARAKVAERKRDAIAAAGGEALSALNRELRMLSIDRAEQEARFKLVSQQLENIGSVTDTIDKYEQLLATYPKLVDRDQEAQQSFSQIESRLDQAVKPTLKLTYSRNWTQAEMSKEESKPQLTTPQK
jgi:hypothetical protein